MIDCARSTRRVGCGVVLFSLLAAVGCGDGSGLVPVSGTVTIDGQPLKSGQLMVYPEGSREAIGRVDEQGHFTLKTGKEGEGVPKGTHPAAVMAVEQVGERELRWHAPRKYSNEGSSGLTVTVDGPTDDLKIELTWQGSGHKGPYSEKN